MGTMKGAILDFAALIGATYVMCQEYPCALSLCAFVVTVKEAMVKKSHTLQGNAPLVASLAYNYSRCDERSQKLY